MKKAKSNFFVQILAELKYGLLSGGYKFILPFIIGIDYADTFIRQIQTYMMYGKQSLQVSFIDCIVYVFRGMREYIPAKNNPFEIPTNYLIIVIVLALFIGNYPLKDLHGFGKNVLVRSRRKSDWWFSKCIWNISTVLVFFLSIYAGVAVRCVVSSSMFSSIGNVNADVISVVLGCNKESIYNANVIGVMVLVLPVLTGIALSLFQMTMAFLTSAIISYISIITVAIFSAYYTVWFLPGNFLMTYRYTQVCENGVFLAKSVMVDVVIIVVSVIVGYVYFRKYDVL